ncbi:MAG TPA: alginate lyase family protein [Candidatus Brocadiia bacterium]|nr:alginate lyase family protein [Candidatus Brocadiia bacterium]
MPDFEKMRHYARRLREMPLKKAVRKGLEKISENHRAKADAAMARRFGAEVSREELLKTLRIETAGLPAANLAENLRKARFRFLASSADTGFGQAFRKEHPGIAERIIELSERVIAGQCDILGFNGPIPPPIWNIDPKSGKRWDEESYYREIPTAPGDGSDIKFPWELSRCHHLATVAQAFALTGRSAYVEYFQKSFDDWRTHNRPKFGCNWVCAMDVAIRAVNWIIATELLWDDLDGGFIERFHASMLEHARHILANLEYSETLTSNHYLSDIAGLVWIAAAFPAYRESDAWLALAMQELCAEIERQVMPDGGDFEASTSYHRLVAEIFLSCTAVSMRLPKERLAAASSVPAGTLPRLRGGSERLWNPGGNIFPESYWAGLRGMLSFTEAIMNPAGRVPQIGDNDSGRLHKLTPPAGDNGEDSLDHRHLFGLAGSVFRGDDLKRLAGPCAAETAWFGQSPATAPEWRSVPDDGIIEIAKPNFGVFGVKSADFTLLLRAGPVGQNGMGGHAHNDQLSLVLGLREGDVLVDPGSFCYTPDPDARNRFRSTESHNTVRIPGGEQNEIRPGSPNLFRLGSSRAGQCETSGLGDDGVWHFMGSFTWPGGFIHKRAVNADTKVGMIRIADSLESASGKAGHSVTGRLNLCFAPGLEIMNEGGGSLIKIGGAKISLNFPVPAATVRRQYSPGYGVTKDCYGLQAEFSGNLEWTIRIEV